MASVKATLNLLDIDDDADELSLLESLFGFSLGRVPSDPLGTGTPSVSLLALLRGVEHEYINVNVIRVALDDWEDSSEADARGKIDWSILRLREILGAVGLGVGRVEHWEIDLEEAQDAEYIHSKAEARRLWRDWTVYNDGIDIFMVRGIIPTVGAVAMSPRPGRCEKDQPRDGLIGGEITRQFDEVARSFAHEVGHFLGLKHTHRRKCPTETSELRNLMTTTKCVNAANLSILRAAVDLTDEQVDQMRAHPCVRRERPWP